MGRGGTGGKFGIVSTNILRDEEDRAIHTANATKPEKEEEVTSSRTAQPDRHGGAKET